MNWKPDPNETNWKCGCIRAAGHRAGCMYDGDGYRQGAVLFRGIIVALALLFLIVDWQRGQNGRYVFNGNFVTDTRTGVVTPYRWGR